jgi:hypothetical protein
MNLQQLIGELQALALAYPDTTPVYVKSDERADSLDTVEVVSEENNLEIHLKG